MKKTFTYLLAVLATLFVVACDIEDIEEFEDYFCVEKDIEGNIYPSVKIGEQVWMARNLETSLLNDGTAIPLVTDDTEWGELTTPAYCYYNNDEDQYGCEYGKLYNWYCVETGKLCPEGWHVSSDEEWTALVDFLGGDDVAGGKLKEAGTQHWLNPNTGATNESCFTGLPNGLRMKTGVFGQIKNIGCFWTSTEEDETTAHARWLIYNETAVDKHICDMKYGYAVRCVKDAEPEVEEIIPTQN